jgi:hypothetical protein
LSELLAVEAGAIKACAVMAGLIAGRSGSSEKVRRRRQAERRKLWTQTEPNEVGNEEVIKD